MTAACGIKVSEKLAVICVVGTFALSVMSSVFKNKERCTCPCITITVGSRRLGAEEPAAVG